MRRYSFFAFLLSFIGLAYNISGSNINLDSLSASVNSAETEVIRTGRIERALDLIARHDPSRYEDLRSKIEYNKLNTHQMLLLDAFDSRKLMYKGYFEEVIDLPAEANPFIQFFKGSAYFYLGDTETAMKNYKSASTLFNFYNDTIYLASTYNNIGALHWHLDNLDSALIYFLKAKQYTSWFNRMLENNILAIANTLNDVDLAQRQIQIIKSNSDDPNDPYLLNNAIQFYKIIQGQKLDSILSHVRTLYPYLSEVPIEILPEFIRQGWMLDSIVDVMLSHKSNSFYEDAFKELLMNPVITDTMFSRDVIHQLAIKTSNRNDSLLAELYAELDSENRSRLAKIISRIESEERLEALKKLGYAARDFQIKIEQKESEIRNYFLIGIGVLIAGLVLIIIGQYRRIKQAKESARLTLANAELLKSNTKMQAEIIRTRSSIEEIAESSFKRLKGIRSAIQELGANQKHAISLMEDLNVITTYEEGMLRFRIKKVVHFLESESLKMLEGKVSERDILIVKLTVMSFKSKEIASLMGVTPQHVNNMRSKLKTIVEDHTGSDYDSFMEKVQEELFKSY
jgi:tetratricopeptide (TPR) repeat protein